MPTSCNAKRLGRKGQIRCFRDLIRGAVQCKFMAKSALRGAMRLWLSVPT
jgi:hypothetical protein